jgi:hypothetical protein
MALPQAASPPPAAPPAKPPRRPGRPVPGVVLRGLMVGATLALSLEAGRVLFGANFHAVIAGAFYRCSQPTTAQLEAFVRDHGVRTVLNLRGCCDPAPWYLEECRAGARLDLSQEEVGLSAGRLPAPQAVRELVAILDRSERPVLIHCHKGADRTGLTSAMALLLYTAATPAEARRQLGPRYGHLPLGRTRNMDRFFDLYEEWLTARGLRHAPEVFRRWAADGYCPGECDCAVELLDPPGWEIRMPRGQPGAVRVRCVNTSVKPWRLRPGANAGVHCLYLVTDSEDRWVYEGRAGLFDAEVPPGGSIDLTLALPPLRAPGRYRLRVDMTDEQHAKFFQEGSEPLFRELEVP